jgi:hypothetical protein
LQAPLDNEFSRRYRERFGSALLGALKDREQSILGVDSTQLSQIARHACYEVNR